MKRNKSNKILLASGCACILAGAAICLGLYNYGTADSESSDSAFFSEEKILTTKSAHFSAESTAEASTEASSKVEIPALEKTHEYDGKIKDLSAAIAPETTMYFSNSGSDENDGLSEAKPKKDPTPFLKAGNCKVLLKGGEVFSFTDTVNVGSNVIISTYGSNQRAGVSFVQHSADTFQSVDGGNGIYRAKTNAEQPKTGWISIDGKKNWKKLLENNIKENGEYWVDDANGYLYIKSAEDISGKNFDYALSGNGFYLCNGENCVIENLEIYGAGYHGVSYVTYSNSLVRNCYIHHMGGGIQSTSGKKYGNGVQVWATDSHNIIISDNIVSDCFDAGITVQINSNQHADCYDIYFLNNFVEKCNYGLEIFQTGDTYCVKDTVAANNVFYDIKDITDGYRLTMSSTDFTAFLCLWNCDNPKDNILIKDNFGISTQKYAMSFQYETKVKPYVYENNKLIVNNQDAIKNKNNYGGDDAQILDTTGNDALYQQNMAVLEATKANYNFSSFF